MFLGIPIGYAKKLTKSEATEEYNRMYIVKARLSHVITQYFD
jgi:hypothetical protein